MNTRTNVWLAGLALSASLSAAVTAQAEEALGYETWPMQTGGTAPVILVDVWTFSCVEGGSATVSIDTMAPPSGIVSTVDPVMGIFDASGTLVADGDDEVTCSFAQLCEFDCPQATFNCPGTEEITIQAWTSSASGTGDCGQDEGSYALSVEVFDDIDGGGVALSAAEVNLGGKESSRVHGWGRYAAGPAHDDIMVPEGFAIPVAPAAAGENAGVFRSLNADRKLTR